MVGEIGYTPFDRDTQQQEMEAIIAGDYKFEPGACLRLFFCGPHPLMRAFTFTFTLTLTSTSRSPPLPTHPPHPPLTSPPRPLIHASATSPAHLPTEEYWENVSETAKDFVRTCLTVDPTRRPTAAEALQHKWLADTQPHFVEDGEGRMADLLPGIVKAFDARKTCKCPFVFSFPL